MLNARFSPCHRLSTPRGITVAAGLEQPQGDGLASDALFRRGFLINHSSDNINKRSHVFNISRFGDQQNLITKQRTLNYVLKISC
jgi:hypothetical protein